jgi:hypothetical protein
MPDSAIAPTPEGDPLGAILADYLNRVEAGQVPGRDHNKHLGERRAALEDEVRFPPRIGKNFPEEPADPVNSRR